MHLDFRLKKSVRLVFEYLRIISPRIDYTSLPRRLQSPVPNEKALSDTLSSEYKFIFIHGIEQRSGTVYLGELLRLHPHVRAFPRDIWEIPFMQSIHHLVHFETDFINQYPQNENILKQTFFLQLFANAFLDFLKAGIENNKRILLKQPSVKNLSYFPVLFPRQNLIVLVRDGRDVVASKINTWPNIDFETACHTWNSGAEEILSCERVFREKDFYTRVHFESLVRDTRSTIESLLDRIKLPRNIYPFENLPKLPVRGSSETAKEGHPHWNPVVASTKFSPIARWANWTDRRKRCFAKIAGESMKLLGYTM